MFGTCLINNLESRPLQTLDGMFERQMKKRLNMFHARPIDRTQYDKDILSKQMDLETMRITLNKEENRMKQTFVNEYDGQCGEVAYTRKITREQNEEGKWKRLIKEIEDMAHSHGVEFDDALKIFESVSCCKK